MIINNKKSKSKMKSLFSYFNNKKRISIVNNKNYKISN